MMNRNFAQITISCFLVALSLFFLSFKNAGDDKDLNTCLTKVDYKWGAECKPCNTGGKTYKVRFVNSCTDTLSVKIAVQENHKRWRTFNRPQVLPNDTISGFACEGTGKYLYWTKKWNDNTVDFPTDEEINSKHNK